MRKLLIVLALLSLPAVSDKLTGGSGIIYGSGHAYYLKAPEDWIFDNESGVTQGLHCVIYPQGSDWARSRAVIYSGVTAKKPGQTPAQIIAEDLTKFRKQFPQVKMNLAPDLTTEDKRVAQVREFTGGNEEMVAYIDTPKVVCEVILSCRDRRHLEEAVPAFEYVVASFRFIEAP